MTNKINNIQISKKIIYKKQVNYFTCLFLSITLKTICFIFNIWV